MLDLTAIHAGSVSYQVQRATVTDYLIGRAAGRWHGALAACFGLIDGEVTELDLNQLLAGRSPSGKLLVQGQTGRGLDRQMGWHVTLSLGGKEPAVFSSVLDDDQLLQFEACAYRALERWIKQECQDLIVSRRGKGGTRIENVTFAAASFLHWANKNGDSHPHFHVLIPSLGQRGDGTFGTIVSRNIYKAQRRLSRAFDLLFAQELRDAFGLEVSLGERGLVIDGVPQELCRAHSSRRVEIEAYMAERNLHGAEGAKRAAKATRRVLPEASLYDLRLRWARMGEAHGFTNSEARLLIGAVNQAAPTDAAARSRIPAPDSHSAGSQVSRKSHREAREFGKTQRRDTRAAVRACLESVNSLAARSSSFTKDQLLGAVRKRLAHRKIPVATVLGAVRTTLENTSLVRCLDLRSGLYATVRTYAAEATIIAWAAQADRSKCHKVRGNHVRAALRSSDPSHTRCLVELVRPSGVALLTTAPGSHKHELLLAASSIWKQSGYDVLGVAVTGRAARELALALHPEPHADETTTTLSSLLFHLSLKRRLLHHAKQFVRAARGKPTFVPFRLSKRHVIVLDQAARASSIAIAELIPHVRAAGAKLVLVDAAPSETIHALGAGGAFYSLTSRLPTASHLPPPSHVSDGLGKLREGKYAEAASSYVRSEQVQLSRTWDETLKSVVSTWDQQRTSDLSKTLILAGTRSESAALNQACQEVRHRSGELGESITVSRSGKTFAVGDRVRLTKNRAASGFMNGDLATVIAVRPKGFGNPMLSLRLDRNGSTVILGISSSAPVELAYSTTQFLAARGSGLDRVFACFSAHRLDRQRFTAAAALCEKDARLFVTDERSRIRTTSDLAIQIERDRRKQAAHDLELPSSRLRS